MYEDQYGEFICRYWGLIRPVSQVNSVLRLLLASFTHTQNAPVS